MVASSLDLPAVAPLDPAERYWSILRKLLADSQATGALVSDAGFAALALEHGATLATTDRGFTRLAGLKLLDSPRELTAGHAAAMDNKSPLTPL